MKTLIISALITFPFSAVDEQTVPAAAAAATATMVAQAAAPAEREPQPESAAPASATADEMPTYVPPRLGAPKTRVGGGSRSGGGEAPRLVTLSPEHTGLTQESSPTLYWWLSADFEGEFEFVVTSLDAIEPALRIRESGPRAAGIHALSLGEHGLKLDPGRLYQWSVAIVRSNDARSLDIVSIGTIERVAQAQSVAGDPAALARAGFWYDSFAAIGRLLRERSDPAPLRKQRASLLEQVALPEVAAWQRANG